MCRKASGSAFATNMLIEEADFVVTSGLSSLKAYHSSPGENRYFCSECGSPIYSEAAARKGVVSVRCGTLDSDPPSRPTEHIHTGSKAPWFERSEEHTSELQSRGHLVCRLLLEKK